MTREDMNMKHKSGGMETGTTPFPGYGGGMTGIREPSEHVYQN